MKDILPALKNVGIAVALFLLLVLIGNSNFSWTLIVATPIFCGGFAYYFSNGNMGMVLRAAAIGLVAGVGFYFAI